MKRFHSIFSLLILATIQFTSDNAYCDSNLEELYYHPLSGTAFINNWDDAGYNDQYGVTLSAYDKIRLKSNATIDSKIRATITLSEGSKEPEMREVNQWFSCAELDSGKYVLKTLADNRTIKVASVPLLTKLDYVINGHKVGSVNGIIMDISNAPTFGANSITSKVISGEYSFVNGEKHSIMYCVDHRGALVGLHQIDKLSEKGEKIKKSANVENWIFYKNDMYDMRGKSKDSFWGNRTFDVVGDERKLDSFDLKCGSDLDEAEFKNVKINYDTKNENLETVELKKCDGSATGPLDKVENINYVTKSDAHVDYYYLGYKYMEFDGRLRVWPEDYILRNGANNPSKVLSPLNGIFKLSNGEVINYNVCTTNGRIDTTINTIKASEYGQALVKKIKAEETAYLAEKKTKDEALSAKYAKERRENEAKGKKAIAEFRRNAKVGTAVRITRADFIATGTVVDVDGDKLKVQYAMRAVRGQWIPIQPFTEWVNRSEITKY